MDFTDFMWIKLLALCVLAAIVGWQEGRRGEK
jgi:hypothetical protein